MNETTTYNTGVASLQLTHTSDGVAQLALNRPHRRNALDRELLDTLPTVLRQLDEDPDVRAIVVTGSSGAFCAGGDLDIIGQIIDETPETARQRMAREFASASLLLRTLKPTVAAVDGAAVGAGMALALACDVRLGSPRAVFAAPFIKMGLVPDFGVSWLLTRAVGAARATEIAVSGRKVGADEAVRIGLLDVVVPDPLTEAVTKAKHLAAASPEAAGATKRLMQASERQSYEELLELEIEEQIRAVRSGKFARLWADWSEKVRGH
ncbi:enoyl-CoA hydratase/isomerase family protein [Saccharopolyspora pogona]|uniref:enoyl-CoA hydratase/isomerase family protein n=1 Tax=Saccharopolyspora pogona TaxID=333966 RepID=UPI0016879DB5|nr:enoyl-CoA hydratase/isomerase family protein [Saccharopolyspora pogona]